MKFIIPTLVILLFVLSSCTSQKATDTLEQKMLEDAHQKMQETKEQFEETTKDVEDGSANTDVDIDAGDIDVEEKDKEEQQLDRSWKQVLLESLGEIINKAEEKSAKGYSFVYSESGAVTDFGKYYVKGDKIRFDIYDKNAYLDVTDKMINVVYIDLTTGDAYGYCDSDIVESPIPCNNVEDDHKVKVSRNAYMITMPYDVLATIDEAVEKGPKKIDDRNTIEAAVTFTDGETGTIWLDQFSGIPVQVEKGSDTTYYKRLFVGLQDNMLVYGEE